MKKIISYISVALLVVAIGCNDDDNNLPVIKPEKTGMVTIGENTYEWVRYAGLDWMTSNFKEGTPYYELTYINQYGYTDDLIKDCEDLTPEEWDRYGNLYSYEEEKANAPEGWRLPNGDGYCIAFRWICHCNGSTSRATLPALERVRLFLDGYGREK